jgi:hypothetical protein
MVSKEIIMTKKNVKSATDEILLHLKSKTITSAQANEKYGVSRLAAIIFVLRERGYNIITHDVEVKTRYNHSTTIAKYQYIKPSK